jgi:hypothetical protein
VLQITAKHGDLAFLNRQEFQVLPEGDTYRIYLGDDSGSGAVTGGAGGKIWGANKIGYFIVGERLREWPPGAFTTLLIRRVGLRVLRNREEKKKI